MIVEESEIGFNLQNLLEENHIQHNICLDGTQILDVKAKLA